MEIPVYLVTGFLNSGKTTFLNDILEEGFARDGGRTLLLRCENGVTDYRKKARAGVQVINVSSEDELDYGALKKCEKAYKPKQILVEYNGMWQLDSLLDILPANWVLYQVMTFVDAATFDIYAKNLGQLMMEKIKIADMIVFNRCTDQLKEQLRSRNLRMVNRGADIFLEGADGEPENYRTGEECPFDLNQEMIEIPDEDFGFWYVDVMDHPERYKGHKVHMKLMQCRSMNYPGIFCPGRMAMVCCEEDITFFGIMARGEELEQYPDRSWIEVTGVMDVVQHPAYDTGDGPVIDVLEVLAADKPTETVVSF